MVLGWRRPGRVGRCRIPQRKASDECLELFLCVSGEILLPAHLRRSQRTYLVRIFPAARSAGCRKNHLEGQDIVVFWVFRNQNICLWKRIKIYAIMSITNRTRCNEEKRRCPLGSFVWTKTVAQRGARSIQKAKKCLVWYSVHRNLLRSIRQRLKPNISEKS